MYDCQADVEKMRRGRGRSAFRPLVVGLHWPSQPLGDESLAEESFSVETAGSSPIDRWVEECAEQVAGTPAAPEALRRCRPHLPLRLQLRSLSYLGKI
jgi:hypothetical protein